MGVVGAMKAVGLLRHDLSRIVGVFEFFGGFVIMPGWPAIKTLFGSGTPKEVIGCLPILLGLGLIVATPKRKSPICWSQVVLCLVLIRSRPRVVGGKFDFIVGVVAFAAGIGIGLILQALAIDQKKLS